MEKKITDVSIRKMVDIPGETQKVSIGGGLFLWVTITLKQSYSYYAEKDFCSGQNA